MSKQFINPPSVDKAIDIPILKSLAPYKPIEISIVGECVLYEDQRLKIISASVPKGKDISGTFFGCNTL